MNGHLQVRILSFYLISWTQENTLLKIKSEKPKGNGEEAKLHLL